MISMVLMAPMTLPFGPRLVQPIAVVLIGVGSFSLLH
jgi:hypothetical protein